MTFEYAKSLIEEKDKQIAELNDVGSKLTSQCIDYEMQIKELKALAAKAWDDACEAQLIESRKYLAIVPNGLEYALVMQSPKPKNPYKDVDK